MEDTREEEEFGDRASSPKRPRLQGRDLNPLRDPLEHPPQEDQAVTASRTTQSERMAEILARYKAWARNGSPRHSHCVECGKDGELVPCATCSGQYHESCKPQISAAAIAADGLTKWYCTACVGNKWHINPPVLTPPASPSLQRIEVAPAIHQSRGLNEAEMTQTPPRQPEAISQVPPSTQTPSQLPPSFRTPRQLPSSTQTPHQLPPSTRTPSQPSLFTQTPNAKERRRRQRGLDASNTVTQGTANRRSRYSTASVEVDSALAILHREVEKVTMLNKKIEDLESDLAGARQQLVIKENELKMTQKVADRVRASDAQVQKLREEAARMQAVIDEKKTVEAKNTALEAEVERFVENWRQKKRHSTTGSRTCPT